MAIFAQTFERANYNIRPILEESVVVVFETSVPYEDETLEEFDRITWEALWKQYPLWVCPYHQGNPPPNALANWRHGFSSPTEKGAPRRLS